MHDLRCVGVCCRKLRNDDVGSFWDLHDERRIGSCVVYRNDTVTLRRGHCLCDHVGGIDVMHHHSGNPNGKHLCPTGFIMCFRCGAIGREPDPPLCTMWEETT